VLFTVLEEGAVSGIVQLAEVHYMQETYCILHMEFSWLRTKQCSLSALFWVICNELIIISIQSIV